MGQELLDDLSGAIKDYNAERAIDITNKALAESTDPIKMLDAMTIAIREIGDGFGKGELFLPDLVGAADTMSAVMPIIEEEIKKKGAERKSLGSIVIGTVFGDIHSIGKTMVSTLLIAEGFEVHDLGVNVKGDEFLSAVKDFKADILAMSSLLTTTSAEQRNVVKALQQQGLKNKVKVMVGGGAITQEFAENIGADGYDPTAPGAIMLAKKLRGIN